MNANDLIRLRHMLDYGREVMQFTLGETRTSLDTDLKLVRALCMSIGIIGEAASHVSQEFQDGANQIPWKDVIGMRNFLFHAYHRIDLDIVWNTATSAVPVLVGELMKLISSTDSQN